MSSPRPSPMGSTTSATTRAGYRSATPPIPRSSPSSRSAAGGTRWARPLPRRLHLVDHRRRRRIQRHRGCGPSSTTWPSWPPRPGLSITVCHYPPGTSKWNKIEHRLFSFISHQLEGSVAHRHPHHRRAHRRHQDQDRSHRPVRLRPRTGIRPASRSATVTTPPSRYAPTTGTASGTTASLRA